MDDLYAKESSIVKKVDGIQDDMLRDEASDFFTLEEFEEDEDIAPDF